MSILVDKNTKIIIQGFTGKQATFHAKECLDYGTQIVGGVTPGKGGITHLDKPVFNTVDEALNATKANVSLVFVPPAFALDAILEATDAGIKLIIIITEGIPLSDMAIAKRYVAKRDTKIIGPNCPGIITSGECKAGIIPGDIFKKGQSIIKVGIISKSGTLTYEASAQVIEAGFGISTAIGIGGDPIIGLDFIDILKMFEKDKQTKAVIMIGEIGGNLEMQAATFIKKHIKKPVLAFIAGASAPKGKKMGHAGAIVQDDTSSAKDKIQSLRQAGVDIADNIANIGTQIAKML